jgi:hypothetical protein
VDNYLFPIQGHRANLDQSSGTANFVDEQPLDLGDATLAADVSPPAARTA